MLQDAALPAKKPRQSNIELLRIVCMVLIVAHHAVVHGGALQLSWSGTKALTLLVLPAGKIGFDCFLAISMWFLCMSSFKASRFVRTWLQVLFYTVLMTVVAYALGAEVTAGQWIGSFLPIGGISHGFAATYLAFYLFLPIIAKASSELTRKQALWAIVLLAYLQIFETILGSFSITILSIHQLASEFTLFLLCYFVMLYLRKWPHKVFQAKGIMFAVAGVVWLCIFALSAYQAAFPEGRWASICSKLMVFASDESSLLYFIAGVALFMAVKSIPMKENWAINLIASTTFGVLLFHDHNVCRQVFWGKIVHMPEIWGLYGIAAIVGFLMVVVMIYSVGVCIDLLRQKTIEPLILKTGFVKVAIRKMDGIWNASPSKC